MASICDDPGGLRRVLFTAPDGKRVTVRLGKCDRKSAESVRRYVEMLLASKITGQPPARDVAVWVQGLGDKLRDRLAAAGLIEAPRRALLGEFLRGVILNREDVKPATLEIWGQPVRNLIEHFGDDRPLRSINPGDAERFAQWLRTQGLAPATLAKRLSFARTFFHVARRNRLVDENPFTEVKIPAADVSKRQSFVTRGMIDRLMGVADPTWRVIIALARFGGLRCPSEVLSLEWRHIDWGRGRMTVISPKTERHDGKGSREVPLFKDLRPFLTEAFEAAAPGQTHVVGGGLLERARGPKGWRNCNLRTHLLRLIDRAGLEPWPRAFHNLRSSCETELLDREPMHAVAAWMGHDVKVMVKHYAQVPDELFDRASGASESGAESGAPAAQKAAQQITVPGRNEPQR